jgi:hypothetical protein
MEGEEAEKNMRDLREPLSSFTNGTTSFGGGKRR